MGNVEGTPFAPCCAADSGIAPSPLLEADTSRTQRSRNHRDRRRRRRRRDGDDSESSDESSSETSGDVEERALQPEICACGFRNMPSVRWLIALTCSQACTRSSKGKAQGRAPSKTQQWIWSRDHAKTGQGTQRSSPSPCGSRTPRESNGRRERR